MRYFWIPILLFSSPLFATSIKMTQDGSGSIKVTQDGTGSILTSTTAAAAPVGDGEVGTNVVDSNNSGRTNNIFYYSSFTVTTAGNVNYCHINVGEIAGGSGLSIGLYSDTGSILATANGTTGVAVQADWLNYSLDSQVELAAATDYICGYVTEDTSHRNSKDDVLTGSYRFADSMTYATTLSNFDPATPDTFQVYDSAFSCICDNQSGDP